MYIEIEKQDTVVVSRHVIYSIYVYIFTEWLVDMLYIVFMFVYLL